jgi:hypothetical protein
MRYGVINFVRAINYGEVIEDGTNESFPVKLNSFKNPASIAGDLIWQPVTFEAESDDNVVKFEKKKFEDGLFAGRFRDADLPGGHRNPRPKNRPTFKKRAIDVVVVEESPAHV